jgi:lipopolysaccharide/colanic/teichoic acid biosynthesis glycosyltransferase
MTGLWQVHGGSNIPFGEMVQLDYRYVRTWSLWTDVLLLIRTGAVVLRGSGC